MAKLSLFRSQESTVTWMRSGCSLLRSIVPVPGEVDSDIAAEDSFSRAKRRPQPVSLHPDMALSDLALSANLLTQPSTRIQPDSETLAQDYLALQQRRVAF